MGYSPIFHLEKGKMKITEKCIMNFLKLFLSNLCLEYVKIDSNLSVDRLGVHISGFEAL